MNLIDSATMCRPKQVKEVLALGRRFGALGKNGEGVTLILVGVVRSNAATIILESTVTHTDLWVQLVTTNGPREEALNR